VTQKSELPTLLVSLFLTGALLAIGGWWLYSHFPGFNDPIAGADGRSGRSIMPEPPSLDKQKGLNALKQGDYAEAKTALATALLSTKNDPESRIYLNNAKLGNSEAYTLAVVVPVKQGLLNQTHEILRGAAQAQTDINEKSGGTRPIRLLIIDDDGTAERARTLATALVKHKEVLGVVGHFSSDSTLAAAETYEAGKLPMVSPTSNADKISDAGDYIFRTVTSARISTNTLIDYLLTRLKKKKAAVFWASDSEFSQSVESEFSQKLSEAGGQVVDNFDVDAPDFDVEKAMQVVKDQGAEALMIALPSDLIGITNQIIELNQQALPMLGSSSLYGPKVLEAGQNNALGLTVSVPWHSLKHKQSPFVKAAKELWGGDINWRTATTYDAVVVLATGLNENPTRAGIAAALANPKFQAEGATGKVQFFPNGDRRSIDQLVQVVPGNRSGTGYDFVPID
jgi:branched-chain amino acid transport system substrate-binding protein